MIKCSFFSYKKILVVGLKRTGLASVNALIDSNAEVYGYDDDLNNLTAAKIAFPVMIIAQFDTIDWHQIDYILLSPGVPLYFPKSHKIVEIAIQFNIEIISDIDVLYLACPDSTYIGVTGTNGKSTTTALITHIFKSNDLAVQMGGNIGVPVLELQSQTNGFYVLELSSYHLDLIKYLHFDTSIITNITTDHIDRHGTIDKYIQAKLKIINRLQPLGTSIVSCDYEYINQISFKVSNINVSQNSKNAQIFIKDRILYDNTRNLIFDFSKYHDLPGIHNEENIALAYAASVTHGIDPDNVVDSIKKFRGLDHRIQLVHKFNKLTFINDSKATNANAAEKSLKCYNKVYWIAGGIAKDGGITSLLAIIKQNVKLTLLIGSAQLAFAQTLNELNLPYVLAGTLERALDYIKNISYAEGVVLLAPACASFDQFDSFEHRGNEFKKLVMEKFDGS